MVTLGAYQVRPFPCLHWFNRMVSSDIFVILDDFQFKRQRWQQRYEVWMHDHPHRLTIPIDHSTLFKPINEVRTADGKWREKHLKTLKQCYGRDPFFDRYYTLAEICLKHVQLSCISLTFIEHIIKELNIDTDIVYSHNLNIKPKATDYLVEMCKTLNADTYLCGGTAYHSYMELDKFEEADIEVKMQDWQCTYPYQDISILDPLMRYGEEARKWIQ